MARTLGSRSNRGKLTAEVVDIARSTTTTERRHFTYDAFNRLISVHANAAKTPLIAEYRYKGLGQRILWRYDENASGTVASTERFFYMHDDRWRMVGAFWDSGATPQESFVYHAAGNVGRGSSSYIDSVVLRDRDTNADGTLEERRYYVQNWRADVVAITKSDGSPLQYAVYPPYGEPVTHAAADVDLDGDVDSSDQAAWANGAVNSSFAYAAKDDLNHDGSDSAADDALFDESYKDNLGLSGRGRISSGNLDNRKGYAGYEHDESLTMYHVRHRVYRPDLGRWMTRDPLGYVDGMSLYEYVAGMAVVGVDPQGLWIIPVPRMTPPMVRPILKPAPPPVTVPRPFPVWKPLTPIPSLINDLLERCLGDSPLPLIRDVPEDYPAEEPEVKVPDYTPNPDPYRADKKPCEHLVRAYRALAQMAKANENPQTCEEAERLYQLVKEYTIKRLQSDACHEVHKIKSGDHPTATASSLIWRKRVYNQMRDICNKEYQDIRDENDEIYRRMPEVPPNYAVAL